MAPSPAMRCSPGNGRAEKHKRWRSLEGGILFTEREEDDDDLALFNEVQSRERDNFLLQSNDEFEDLFSNKVRYFSDCKLGITVPPRGESSDLLNAGGDKNDYDWLLTPPETPLFPSLDDETLPVYRAQRGRPRSQPISISRSSTMERSNRSSRGSASPNRLSTSPRSSHSTYQSRGRQSPGQHSSPPPGLRPSTPTRRASPPPSKPLTPALRSSSPTPQRISSGPVAPSRVRGNSPVKTGRGSSASPKIKGWQANIPGFSSEAPPNLRTSLADRPASYVRGSSPASKNGPKSGRQSMSPTASRSICSSYSHDRDRFSSHSRGSVASSGDDDGDSLQSIPVSSSDHSAPRSISTFSNSRGLSSSKKPTTIVTSSSAPKRSFDISVQQVDQRKGPPQNMFRPLLSSVPSSTFYAGKSSAAHRSIISRNSSVTTSSNASSDPGASGAHDSEGNEHNQEDITSDCVKEPYHDRQEEVFVFDKADSIDEKSVDKEHEKLIDGRDEYDGHRRLDSHAVGDESSSHRDEGIEISVAPEVLDVKVNLQDADSFVDTLLCSRCGCRYHAVEEISADLKLCKNCRSAEILSVLTNPPETMIADENSPGISANILDHGSADAFTPCAATPVSLAETIGESGTNCYNEPNRNLLPESTGVQGEQILFSQLVGSQPPLSSNTTLNVEIVDQQLQQNGGYSNLKAGVSEGAGISLLLTPSSVKGPIVRSRTFTATSITCDDFSYMRDSATSTRSSFGHNTASASSSRDLGSSRQTEGRAQRQLSSRKLDAENYRYEMCTKHQRSVSSLSGTSTHGFQVSSFTTSSHEESLEVSAVRVEKGNLEVIRVALQDPPLASESIELDNVSIGIESDSNWRTVSELSSHKTNIHPGDTTMASVSNSEDPALHEYVEDLGNDYRSGISVEASSTHPETCWEEDPMSNASTDRQDVAEALNLSSLDAISELEPEKGNVVSPDSVFDVDSQNSKSSMDDLKDSSHRVAPSHDIATSVEESINQDHVHRIIEESTVMLEGQGGTHTRSLTLEEATDSILFCSSIVHNLAYEAANIAIEKENSVLLEGSKPVVTLVGKSNPDRRDSRARSVSKRNNKPQKARQRRSETDSKPPPGNTIPAPEEESEISTTRIVGVHSKGDNMKPPKLESKCNCAIM
ncbi:hypothetical protein ACH5RR_030813 [Cinchona calisaya]|uniref:Uncharacterized protein n=1 Tax=Cinchona calisaya TaxID=153742 RepID=A0ABD2YZY6_9GENT